MLWYSIFMNDKENKPAPKNANSLVKPPKFFEVVRRHGNRARVGIIHTPNGDIQTPAFIAVGTKAVVKALTIDQVKDLGAQAVLANTYHLYLAPGDELVRSAGGLGKFMNWKGPTFTDSGGFQVFSLGAAFNKGGSKIITRGAAPFEDSLKVNDESGTKKVRSSHMEAENRDELDDDSKSNHVSNGMPATIDEDGVNFSSFMDGSKHRFTPESSMKIQSNLGADIIFAFDECTSPLAPKEYQIEAMDRTHRWAKRSLDSHRELETMRNEAGIVHQALFGIVQGGRHEDLRKESARIIGSMDFDGFGIGGSFDKDDMYTVVGWVNDILPFEKPKHLLGIGEPEDFFGGIENGADTFDCVTPTRLGRNGSLYTSVGKINIRNARFAKDMGIIDPECNCSTCKNYTPAYLHHLFRNGEMTAGTLASIHNLHFLVNLVEKIRLSLLDGSYEKFKEEFLLKYKR